MSRLIEKGTEELGRVLRGERRKTVLNPQSPQLRELVGSVLQKDTQPEGEGRNLPAAAVSIAEFFRLEKMPKSEKKIGRGWRMAIVIGLLGLLAGLSPTAYALGLDYYHNTHETKTVYTCMDDPNKEGVQCGSPAGNIYFEVYENSSLEHIARGFTTNEKGVREVAVDKGMTVEIAPPFLGQITDPAGNKFIYADHTTEGDLTVIVIAPKGSDDDGNFR